MSEQQPVKLYLFLAFAWASYCLEQRQWNRGAEDESGGEPGEPTPEGLVHYPLLLIAVKLLLDNLRLAYGSFDGHKAAPLWAAQLSYFLRMAVQPTLLAAYVSLIGSLTGMPWLRLLGGAASVFYLMKGLNAYVTQVHDSLVFSDGDGVARYKMDLDKIPDDGPIHRLPQTVIVVGAVMVTFVTMAATGDVIPFVLQIVALLAKSAFPVEDESGLLVANFAQLVSLSGLMRVERYV